MGRSKRDVSPLIFLKLCIEQVYNINMKEITNYDISNDDRLYEFLREAYSNNEDVMIPATRKNS